jgi:hypothetical protein
MKKIYPARKSFVKYDDVKGTERSVYKALCPKIG